MDLISVDNCTKVAAIVIINLLWFLLLYSTYSNLYNHPTKIKHPPCPVNLSRSIATIEMPKPEAKHDSQIHKVGIENGKVIKIICAHGVHLCIQVGSFHYDFVWECASRLQIMMHLHIFVCLWVNVTLTAYYVKNLNGLRNMLP